MGPHQGMQVLIDLPQAQAKAAGNRHSLAVGPAATSGSNSLRVQNGPGEL